MSALGLGCAKTPAPAAHVENISKKLRIMESNDAARATFDGLLENCIFYISPMYEFLHSQGHVWTAPFGKNFLTCCSIGRVRSCVRPVFDLVCIT
jgi:hypothetical protein